MDKTGFVEYLADIYEHSPWVAECAELRRPYPTVATLVATMQACVERATRDAQLSLIRAHPELAGKLAIRDELTTASRSEQAAAGLNNCSETEFSILSKLNQAYREKFNFPFIVAVRGMNRSDIITAMTQRIANTLSREIEAALHEIGRIANFRLNDIVAD
jgi:2-oxo-4-hydroxy-4-carboxy-5-ureidoimidazoline decarboxylase